MEFTFTFSFWLILQMFILPILLPMLVGIVSTVVTSARAKAIGLLALSVVTALLTNLFNAYQSGEATFDIGLALLSAFVTFVFGVGVHYGFLKPTGTTEVLLNTGRTEQMAA